MDSHNYDTDHIIAAEEKIGVHFAVPAAHPLAAKQQLCLEDLKGQDFLLTEKGMSYRRLLDEWLARSSIELEPVLELGQADLLLELTEQGQGISFLPDYVTAEAVRRGTVKLLELEDFRPDLWKQLLYHRDKWLSPAMQAVIRILTQ